LAVGWTKWFSNKKYSLVFGLLLGWGFWEDPFVLAFAAGFLSAGLCENRWKITWNRKWIPALLGLLLSGGYGLFREWQAPQYDPGYLTYGIAGLSTILYRLRLLAEAFPQFWNDHLPCGYLQASSLGQALDPMGQGGIAVFFRVWTWALFGASLAGYGLFAWRRTARKPLVLTALTPMVLLLLFFLLSDHVWDALCFRYFTYGPVGVALGLGFLMESVADSRRRFMAFFLGLMMLVQGGILIQRVDGFPKIHPADRIVSVLEDLDLREGWANYWVAGAANFLSQDRVRLNQYNSKPFDRKAEWLAYHSPRVALVSVDGLDEPGQIRQLINKLGEIGYHPWVLRRFNEGWSVLELRRGAVGSPLSSE
jgi:hypothetical protein